MLTLYTSPSCTSCRKARAWLQEHEIPFVERNIFSEPLNISELKAILQMTEDGTEEIISTRSKVFQKLNMDLDDLPLKDLLTLVQENPGLLRRPIMIDEKGCSPTGTKTSAINGRIINLTSSTRFLFESESFFEFLRFS